MDTNNTNAGLPLNKVIPAGHSLNLKTVLSICLEHWKWFVLSVIVVLGLAELYLLRTPSVYIRSASLLIKETSNGKATSDDASSMFADMGVGNNSADINNELVTLQSPSIMTETVKRLGLDVEYTVDGVFHNQTVYGADLPIRATFQGLNDQTAFSADLQLLGNNRVCFTGLQGEGVEGKVVEARLGEPFSIGVARMTVSPTLYYKKGTDYPVYHIQRIPLRAATAACQSRFSAVLNDKGTTIIDLFYQDVSTQRAEDVLNTIITVYNEDWLKDKNQVTVSTSQFINDRLGVIERELGDVDEDISSFKSAHLLPNVDAASSMYMTQSQTNSNQLLELSTQLSLARQMRNFIASNKTQLFPVNSGLGSSSIEQQITDYNNNLLQRNSLAVNSSEQNPLVADLDQSLITMRHAILSSIDNLIATLQTQMASLQRNEQQTNTQIAANPNQAKYLQSVGRQQKVKEELYLYLLQKREQNELSQAFTAYNTRLITPPNGSSVPVSPQKSKILLMALAIGLVLPALVLILRERANTTIRDRKDLENLSLPFLGEIPQYVSPADRKQHKKWRAFRSSAERIDRPSIVVKSGSSNIINEAFRVLRTNIEFVANKHPEHNAFLLTSFNPGSGKTFIAMNIAVSFAVKGKRVLVIDGDLRRGSASAYVHSPKTGLSNYLAGGVDRWQDVLVPGTRLESCTPNHAALYQNLTILPVGTIPPNPTELLFDGRFEALLNEARSQYDYIFVDCPPIDIMADTQIIEKMTDRTIFIVRAGLLERTMLPELERIYREKRFKEMSLILNGVESTGRYGSSYGYKYGYYKYGYKGYHDQD